MLLRGFRHHSPVEERRDTKTWPTVFIDEPHRQYKILEDKYSRKKPGRIVLPRTTYDLWVNHKYLGDGTGLWDLQRVRTVRCRRKSRDR
jgi:hypothetical protein